MRTCYQWFCPFLIILLSNSVFAANRVEFEWEIIDGATLYQVEIKNNKGEIKKSKSKSAAFAINLPPGKYEIHGRVLDDSEHFSPWSPWKSFDVPPNKIKMIQLPPKENKVVAHSYLSSIPIEWEATEGAANYLIEITDTQGKIVSSKVVVHPTIRLKVRPGLYSLKITAKTADDLSSEPYQSADPFLVQNIPVDPPQKVEINVEKNSGTFEAATGTTVSATFEIQKFLSEAWQSLPVKTDGSKKIMWMNDLKPGRYRVTLIGKNSFGEVSVPVIKEFVKKPPENILPR